MAAGYAPALTACAAAAAAACKVATVYASAPPAVPSMPQQAMLHVAIACAGGGVPHELGVGGSHRQEALQQQS